MWLAYMYDEYILIMYLFGILHFSLTPKIKAETFDSCYYLDETWNDLHSTVHSSYILNWHLDILF